MSQHNAQDVLAVLTAPALVCAPGGTVVAMNEAAADWLGTSITAAAELLLGELLDTPSESLVGFLQRSQRDGHALCNGYAYRHADRSRQTAMVCHAQRLRGLQQSPCLLLVFSHAAPHAAHECVLEGSAVEESSTPTIGDRATAGWRTHRAEVSGMSELSEVALGLVHEVNQPLTAIATYAHSCRRWLSGGLTDHPKLLPTVDKIIEQAHITGQMISSLKGLVRGHDDVRRLCDLNQLVGESLDVLALDPRIEGCVIESEAEAGACPVVVSPAQIKIVLLNLLRNAVEASLATDRGESRVRVSVSTQGKGWASATVSDSGKGITPEAGEQLFEPFVTSKSDGLGLGLLISRCLATAHAGHIEYRPNVPRGTSFQLLLPLARVSAQ